MPRTTKKTNSDGLRCNVPPELLSQVVRVLSDAPSWVIFSHLKLDGDTLGSASALFEAGTLLGKRVRWIGPDPVPPSYAFLPHVEEYVAQKEYRFDDENELYIFLDSANEDRGVKGLQDRVPGAVVLNIDHHEDNTLYGTVNCVDPTASSGAELLWHIMTAAEWIVTTAVAECLYAGVITDTGGFMFNNTTPTTHRVAAELLAAGVNPPRIDAFIRQTRSLEGMHLWGVALQRVSCWGDNFQFAMTWLTLEDFKTTQSIAADTESLVNQLLAIRGVRFAVLMIEEEDGVKVSFRSKEGTVAAAAVARSLGGGGHPRASGATLPLAMDDAVRTVRETLEAAYAKWLAADR